LEDSRSFTTGRKSKQRICIRRHSDGESHRAGLDPEDLDDAAVWRNIARARSNWLGHPDHYFPLPPPPRALDQCHAALSVLRDIAAD